MRNNQPKILNIFALLLQLLLISSVHATNKSESPFIIATYNDLIAQRTEIWRFPLDTFPASGGEFLNYYDNYLSSVAYDQTTQRVYAIDGINNSFIEINPADGSTRVIGQGTLTLEQNQDPKGLTVSQDGTVYLSSFAFSSETIPRSALYQVDKTTGIPILVGFTSNDIALIDIAIDCDENMFGHELWTNTIHQINTENADNTLVGHTGYSVDFAQNIAFDKQTGTLYAWLVTRRQRFVFGTISTSTGKITAINTDYPLSYWLGAPITNCPDKTESNIEINGSLSGSYYQADRSGEGFVMHISESNDENVIVLYWFTYLEGKPYWVFGTADIADQQKQVTIELFETSGTGFGANFDTDDVEANSWGNITLSWPDCNSINADYTSTLDFGSGSYQLQRIADGIEGHLCNVNP